MQTTLGKILVIGAALTVLGAGCGASSGSQGPDGGLFRSVDGGNTWTAQSRVLTTAATPLSFGGFDVNTFTVDPKDPKSMWVGTSANGIFYSFDGGEGWQQAKNFAPAELQLTTASVNNIAVDPENKCLVYATVIAPTGKSYLIRTADCSRNWGVVYTLTDLKDAQLRSVAINPANSKQLFLGDTVGNVYRSSNAGASWENVARFEDRAVRTIVAHPNGQTVFVGTSRGGLRASFDGGTTWGAVDLKKFAGAEEVYAIALDPAKSTSLLIGTKYGILRSDDLGTAWTALELLTGPQETQILSLAVSPKNSNRIYYSTPKGFYRTDDGGKSWATKRVPTARIIKTLWVNSGLVNGVDTEFVWFGGWRPPQQ